MAMLVVVELSLLLGGMAFGFTSPLGTIFPHRIALVVASLTLALQPRTYHVLYQYRRPLATMLISTVVVFLTGTMVSQTVDPVSLIRWIELLWLFLIGLVVGKLSGGKALPAVVVTGFVVLLISLVDVLQPGTIARAISSVNLPRTPEQLVWLSRSFVRGEETRLQGTFQHPLALGAFAATMLAATVHLMNERAIPSVVGVAGSLLCFVTGILSISRSSVASAAVILTVFSIMYIAKRIRTHRQRFAVSVIAVWVIVGGLVFLNIGGLGYAMERFFPTGVAGDVSLGFRTFRLQLGAELFSGAPVFGHGPGFLRRNGIVLDNFGLTTLVEGGLLGAVQLTLMLVGAVGFKVRRLWPLFLVGLLQVLSFDFWGFWDAGGAYWLICGAAVACTPVLGEQWKPKAAVRGAAKARRETTAPKTLFSAASLGHVPHAPVVMKEVLGHE